jgi:CheY-like chemotaxis protein
VIGSEKRATSDAIFVVEDDPQITALLTDLLEDEGYLVRTGVNGSALIAALAEPPALVILDVMMPGIDGIEFCRQFRANPATADVPVIFITAAPPDILATRLKTVRYEQLIRKPFTLDEILTTVHRYIAG